jgi:hypothetical protein
LKDNAVHASLLTEIRTNKQGKREFVFIDPQGQESFLTEEKLRRDIARVHIPNP